MKKSKEKARYTVDSGCVLVIDPAYLEKVLNLSPEQQEKWWDFVCATDDEHDYGDFKDVYVSGYAFGTLVKGLNDGTYETNEVVNLVKKLSRKLLENLPHG